MDAKEFRNLLLLLRENLQDSDIPHRTTMHNRIIELQSEQAEDLSNQMLVSQLTLFLIFSYFYVYFILA